MSAEYPPSSAPSGPAGGVLGGSYPNPSFAADMATQAELDAEATARAAADGLLLAKADNPYRTLVRSAAFITTAAASGNKYFFYQDGTPTSNVTTPNAWGVIGFIYVDSAEYAVAGLTTKLLLRASTIVGTAAPAVTLTAGLYPLTSSGNALSLGTVLSGSTAVVASPAANGTTSATSGDFSLPSNGAYALGITVSGTPSGNTTTHARLIYRNV